MKKLLSIMACVAMVLVGGLTLTACGGGKTTNASWKDYTKFVEDNKIVFEMDNYSVETKSEIKGEYSPELSEVDAVPTMDGTMTETIKNAIETEVKNEEKVVTKAFYSQETLMDMSGTTGYVKSSTKLSSYYNDDKLYGVNPVTNKKEFRSTKFEEIDDQFNLEYLKDFETEVETELKKGLKEVKSEFELDTDKNAKFTKNEDGKNVTFKMTYAEDKDSKKTTSYAVTFNGTKVTKIVSQEIDKTNEDYTKTITTTIKEDKVSLPKDLNKYVDMTEDGVVSIFEGTEGSAYKIGETGFDINSGDLTCELQGNREYKITGTAHDMDQNQYKVFWGTEEGFEAENAPKYIVIKVKRTEGDEVKYGYAKNDTMDTMKADDDGIVIQLSDARKDIKFVISVKGADDTETVEYTFDLSALYAVAE